MKISDVMTREVVTVDKDERIERVAFLMEKHKISKIPVLEKGSLVGVVTDGELAEALGSIRTRNVSASALHVSSVMRRTFPTLPPDADVEEAIRMAKSGEVGILSVTYDRTLLGVVTKSDLLPLVQSSTPLSQIMSKELKSVAPDDRVIHARRLMLDNGIEHLPVLKGGKIVGIVSEMDVALGLFRFRESTPDAHQSHRLKSFLVSEIMKTDVVTAHPTLTASQAARLMKEKDVGSLPLLDPIRGTISGLVTRSDLLGLVPT